MTHSTKPTKAFAQNKCDSCEALCAGLVLAGSVFAAVFNDNAFTYVAAGLLATPAIDTLLNNTALGRRIVGEPV